MAEECIGWGDEVCRPAKFADVSEKRSTSIFRIEE
jgi:hypothetical protein